MNTDVHQCVDGSHEQHHHGKSVDLTENVSEDPFPVEDRPQGEGHHCNRAQQIRHGEVAQEHVGSCPHALVSGDDDDHHRVANEPQQHDEHNGNGKENGRCCIPVGRRGRNVSSVLHSDTVVWIRLHVETMKSTQKSFSGSPIGFL